MDRLTIPIKLPPDGMFRTYSDEELKEIYHAANVSEKEIYRRLQAYEDTGLSPEEIVAFIADNKRLLDKLIDEIRNTIRKDSNDR